MEWFKEKEKLEQYIINENKSYEEIGRIYGCSSQNIRKVAKKLGIKLLPKRKINSNETFNKGVGSHKCLNTDCTNIIFGNKNQKYCCNKCQKEHERNEKYVYYLKHQNEFIGREINYLWLKKIIINEQNHKCEICGINDVWNDKQLHFILDHIDGDATNNKRENLRLICPNCDSQLDTYKSRNIGKSTRKYKPFSIRNI